MKKNNIKIFLLVLIILTIPVIVKFSYALNNDVRSEEYTIKDNKIYAVPTTYNYRVEELLSKIESEKELKILNSNNDELKRGDNVYSGCKLTAGDNIYEIIVLGDVTGDGLIQIGDVAAIYNHYKGNRLLNDNLVESGKLTGNTAVNIGDVAKLYNYYRGKKALSYYNQNMIDVDKTVDLANSYYNSSDSNTLGTNIIDKLNTNYNNGDQVVVTREGKIELAIKKNDKCYRKSALSNEIEVIDGEYCEHNINRYASNNGRLRVDGSKLVNEVGEEFRITGVSNMATPFSSYATYVRTHEKMYSLKSLSNLKKWGVNGFRIFCSKSFWESASDEEYNNTMNSLKEVVDKFISLDMYVMINWSTGSDEANNPPQTNAAVRFFNDVSSYYKNDYHIMYEIWNEPGPGKTWNDITEHANQVIPVIRTNAPDSIILVGTPAYDTRVDQVIGHELPYNNIMYTHHTYTNMVKTSQFEYLKQAIDAGLPIFETECSAVSSGSPEGDYVNEPQAYTFFKYLDQYNISYMFFGYDTGVWAYNFEDIRKNNYVWDDNLPNSNLRKNALFLKNMLKGQYPDPVYLLKTNNAMSGNEGEYYRSSEWKDKIVSIEFKNTLNVPSNAIIQWDLSVDNTNSIIGYLTETSDQNKYALVIAANGKINAPRDSGYLFEGMKNLKTIDFTNFETVGVANIRGMFQNDESLESLDLSKFDASEITNMINTFAFCKNLKSINFEGWEPTLTNMDTAFRDCQKLESLDLSQFNVENVQSFKVLFYNCNSLKTLNISTWNPSNVTDISKFLKYNRSLEEVNMSSFNISDNTVLDEALYDVKENARIIVKNQDIIDRLQQTTTNNLNFIIVE